MMLIGFYCPDFFIGHFATLPGLYIGSLIFLQISQNAPELRGNAGRTTWTVMGAARVRKSRKLNCPVDMYYGPPSVLFPYFAGKRITNKERTLYTSMEPLRSSRSGSFNVFRTSQIFNFTAWS